MRASKCHFNRSSNRAFNEQHWIDILLRSTGMEPTKPVLQHGSASGTL